MIRFLKDLYQKHREIVLYLFFGGLTTLVSIASYLLFRIAFNVSVSQTLSWIFAVTFAYVTNKLFVFRSNQDSFPGLVKEIVLFFGGRVFTGFLEFAAMMLLVNEGTPKLTEAVIKVVVTVVVIILNYILSKLFVFAKKTGARK